MAVAPRLIRALDAPFVAVRWLVFALLAVTGTAILAMMMITCADVVMRRFGEPITGAWDLVGLCGAIAIAGALPYTTAVKGHVAIEYFFHKLPHRGRIVVDSITRVLVIALFAVLTWQGVLYGQDLAETGQVTPTLLVPLFWLPWFIAFCCATVVLVVLFNLLHPGREMIKP